MSPPYSSNPAASSYPAHSQASQSRQQSTNATSGSHAQQAGFSRQFQNLDPAFAGPSADTYLPAYSQDLENPPAYRKFTQVQELVVLLQSQVDIYKLEARIKRNASRRYQNLLSCRRLAADASLLQSMADFGGESLDYMHSRSVSCLEAAHKHLKSIVEGKPPVTEANKEFCKLQTDAFLVVALPNIMNPDWFTWEVDNRINSPYGEARRFWTTGLDSKSQQTVAKLKMHS